VAVKKTPKTQSSPVSRDDLPAGQAELSQPSIELKQRSRQGWKWLDRLISLIMWLLAVSLVGLAGYLGWEQQIANAAVDKQVPAITKTHAIQPTIPVPEVEIPGFAPDTQQDSIARQPVLHTIIPTRPREDKVDYTVEQGDSVFGIAQKYNLKPESILWANYDQLQDSPDSLSVGMVLNIPPLDGVYYQWQENDTIASVAAALKAEPGDILNWPGNKLDLTNPVIEAGQYIMVPGGEREFRSWIVPQIARGKAGVSPSVYGAGACAGSYEGAYGTGGFIWPAVNHFLSGNDFWSGHLGIDIAGGLGDSVMASDSGVIVFAGWATGGYGYMIMIDHGNGYQTVYAHLSNVAVSCGQSVYQGGYIGAIGSTGNSTGAHLHFEVRLWGQFVNPWHVLP
jgi:murein DD-endopeptidase MepM/ murein hydrolase activator NlpD